MASSNQFYKSGTVLLEMLLALALTAIITPAIINGLITSRQGEPQQDQRQTALSLLKETQDSLRLIREKGWSTFSVNGVFHPQISADTWSLLSGTEIIGDFYRGITVSDVYRDASGNIGTSGTLDPSTKKITTNIGWQEPYVSNIDSVSYFTRYLDNVARVDTTYNQFNAGIQSGVTVNYTNNDPVDGDITLGGGGHGDWCKPNLTIYGFNLNHNANARAISAIEGRAYAVTGENNSSETFFDVTISDTNPPIATSAGNTTVQKKAYSVFGDQNYAYYATDTKQEQGTIVDLSNHQEIGFLDMQLNNVRGRSITVSNNLAYLSGTNNKIYIYDISTKTGTHTPIYTSSTLGGLATKLVVIGDRLFASLSSTSNQLLIFPLTNNGRVLGTPVSISVAGQGGRDIFVREDGHRTYLITSLSATNPELFIIDTDTLSPTYQQTLANYDTSGMDPQGITSVTNNKVVIVGVGGIEYQVVDVANDVISNCSGTLGDFNIDIYGIASVVEADGDAYSYIITSDTVSEFKIIEGGPSGKVGKSGVFESAIIDTGYSTALNRLFYSATVPSGTTLTFQVAVADPVLGSCDTSDYIYQDLNSFGVIPFDNDNIGYENPGRCFRYKILFDSTSAGSTPVVYSVTINYSP